MSEELEAVMNKVKGMDQQRKAEVAAKLKKLSEPPPKPTTWIGKLWEHILRFFGRRRRPFTDIWNTTKSIGGKGVAPVVTGVSVGLFTGWILCASARIADFIRVVAH